MIFTPYSCHLPHKRAAQTRPGSFGFPSVYLRKNTDQICLFLHFQFYQWIRRRVSSITKYDILTLRDICSRIRSSYQCKWQQLSSCEDQEHTRQRPSCYNEFIICVISSYIRIKRKIDSPQTDGISQLSLSDSGCLSHIDETRIALALSLQEKVFVYIPPTTILLSLTCSSKFLQVEFAGQKLTSEQ